MQHAGNGAVVNRLAGINGVGVIFFHQTVHLGKLLQIFAEFCLATIGSALSDYNSQTAASENKKYDDKKRPEWITLHHEKPPCVWLKIQPTSLVYTQKYAPG